MSPAKILLLFAFALSLTQPNASADVRLVRFEGQLAQMLRPTEQVILRQFQCVLIDGPEGSFFFLQDASEGCPWPDSFGTATHPGGNGVVPHLVYRFQGSPYSLPLPPLKIDVDPASDQASWQTGDWTWTQESGATVDSAILKLSGTERRGRRQKASFDRATGILMSAEADVFMGQGEKFQLQLNRTSVDSVSNETAAIQRKLQQQLLKLQSDLNRRDDSQRDDLSPRQIRLAQKSLSEIGDVPQEVPARLLVDRIRKELSVQEKQMKSAQEASAELIGSTVPEFELMLLNGKPLKSAQLSGRPTVLHFWDYSQNAMEEPYGQVGYLEFLNAKAGQRGVQFVGVITNSLIHDRDRKAVELRSAKKVAEFMNLSYAIGHDDGSLKAHFDPAESLTGNMPLWVVLDANGKVIHYRQGFYEIDRRVGLKELAEAIDDTLK